MYVLWVSILTRSSEDVLTRPLGGACAGVGGDSLFQATARRVPACGHVQQQSFTHGCSGDLLLGAFPGTAPMSLHCPESGVTEQCQVQVQPGAHHASQVLGVGGWPQTPITAWGLSLTALPDPLLVCAAP